MPSAETLGEESSLLPTLKRPCPEDDTRRRAEGELQAHIRRCPRIFQEQKEQCEAQRRGRVVFSVHEGRKQQHGVHHDRTDNRSRKAQHRREKEHCSKAHRACKPPSAQTQKLHEAHDQRDMQSRDRHNVRNANNGHLIFRFIGKPAAVAGQKRPNECLGIG